MHNQCWFKTHLSCLQLVVSSFQCLLRYSDTQRSAPCKWFAAKHPEYWVRVVLCVHFCKIGWCLYSVTYVLGTWGPTYCKMFRFLKAVLIKLITIGKHGVIRVTDLSRLMRLWHLSPSVNSFFKHACAAIHCGYTSDFWSDPSSTSILYVSEQRRLWQNCAAVSPEPSLFAYAISTIISWAGSFSCWFSRQKSLDVGQSLDTQLTDYVKIHSWSLCLLFPPEYLMGDNSYMKPLIKDICNFHVIFLRIRRNCWTYVLDYDLNYVFVVENTHTLVAMRHMIAGIPQSLTSVIVDL